MMCAPNGLSPAFIDNGIMARPLVRPMIWRPTWTAPGGVSSRPVTYSRPASLTASRSKRPNGIVELRSTGHGQDGVRYGSKLVQKLGYVANGLQSADFKPTNQQLAVQKDLEDRLKASQGQLGDVLNRELGAFNDMLRRANLPNIVSQVSRRPISQ